MRGKFSEQAVELPFPAYDAHRCGQTGRRFDQTIGDGLGNRVGNAYPELHRAAALRVIAQRLLQFGPEGEDVLRIAEGEPPGLGQLEVAAAPGKQGRSQVVLQQPDLPAEGLRRQMQLLARPRHAARLGNAPEVVQVFEIHRAYPSDYSIDRSV